MIYTPSPHIPGRSLEGDDVPGGRVKLKLVGSINTHVCDFHPNFQDISKTDPTGIGGASVEAWLGLRGRSISRNGMTDAPRSLRNVDHDARYQEYI